MTTVAELRTAAGRQPPLRAPYNFAPLNETVLETPWAPEPWNGEPDHGKPHPYGLCGELVVDWTVETPLLVGGNDNNAPFQLGTGGPYAIPGASLRGMIRAVLEILSYGRLDLYDKDQRFSIRDYDAVTWKKVMRETSGPGITPPKAGWLKKDGDNYRLTRCEMVEIEIVDICTALGLPIRDNCSAWHTLSLYNRHRELVRAGLCGVINLGCVSTALAGQRGTLVVAGLIKSEVERQSNPRIGATNKHREVAFLNAPSSSSWIISKDAFDAFADVQVSDGNTPRTPPVENWSFWEPELEANQAIPVFYRGNPIRARQGVPAPTEFVMALTKLMRFPHSCTTADVVQRTQRKDALAPAKLDFVQALFGHVPPQKVNVSGPAGTQRAWRGRVRFGFATTKAGSSEPVPLAEARPAVTMKPRASFYPFYLRPKANGETVTHPVDWSNEGARLAGRKRYPPRNAAREVMPRAPQENPEQENALRFLDAAPDNPLVFRSTIRFHNLLPEELGGLAWAIRLQRTGSGETRRLRHMLGRAKAFGYGQVAATIVEDDPKPRIEPNAGGEAPSLTDCARVFEEWVTRKLEPTGTDFIALPEVAAFLALCDVDLGAAVNDALAFPRMPEHGPPGDEAERILRAYSTIKKRSACRRSNDDPMRQGGNPIARDPANAAFLILPEYPPEL